MLAHWTAEAAACAAPGERILDLQAHGAYVACITSSTLQLWICGPHVHLAGWAQQTPQESARRGTNSKLAWHPDGRRLAVMTRDSHILLFHLAPTSRADSAGALAGEEKWLDLQLRAQAAVGQGCGSGRCLVADSSAIAMGYRSAPSAEGASNPGVLAAIGWDGELMGVLTVTSPLLLAHSNDPRGEDGVDDSPADAAWTGEGPHRLQLDIPLPSSSPLELTLAGWDVVECVFVCAPLGLVGLVGGCRGSSCAVVITSRGELETPTKSDLWRCLLHAEGVLVQPSDACCIALNARSHLIAVGCSNGDVRLYDIVNGGDFAAQQALALRNASSSPSTPSTPYLFTPPQYPLPRAAPTHTTPAVYSTPLPTPPQPTPPQPTPPPYAQSHPSPAHPSPPRATLAGPLSITLKSMHILSLTPWLYEPTGAAHCITFTADGLTLAIGYTARGASLFATCGTLCGLWPASVDAALVSTLILDDACLGAYPAVCFIGQARLAGRALGGGVTTLSWAAHDAQLIAAAAPAQVAGDAGGTANDETDCMWILNVLRRGEGIGAARPMGEKALLLLSVDHLRLSEVTAAGSACWRPIHPPSSYIDRSWPLRLAALSPDAHHVAVAGERGVAVAQLRSQRWRFYGASATMQTPFQVDALVWLSADALLAIAHHVLPIGSSANVTNEAGSDLFLLVLRADLSTVLLRQALNLPEASGPPWGCAHPSETVLLLGVGPSIFRFHVALDSRESAAQLGIPLRVAISLSETIRLPATTPEPVGLSAVKLTEHSKREISSPLASDGISDQRDHVFDGLPTDLRFEAIVLLMKLPRTAIHRECSSSFASPSSPDPPHTVADGGTIWSLTHSGMWQWDWSQCTPAHHLDDESTTVVEDAGLTCNSVQLLPTAREVCPLTVLPELSAVVGISYLPLPSFSDPLGPIVHMEPVLHRQLHHLLLDGKSDVALAVARRPKLRRNHCLEVLLHEALASAKSSSAASIVLSASADLLRRLGRRRFCLVAARCARKTDVNHWELLFSVCGPPMQLLRECLESGDPQCAAAFLVPIQALEGLQPCRQAMKQISEFVEARGLDRLAGQLSSFKLRLQGADEEVRE
ncbi:hypothetical protein AB1Y20_003098 [Prymnesium parvum]|uniref:RIC1 C-terminal alpha solenoid region domain-containing protein n=1 Tax=Prymnesium parvum TaxID=97485 RepID=A0AB34JAF8_PRYPA